MTRAAVLIAYTCEPHKSGEAAIGWGYLLEAARRFDTVYLVTRRNNLEALRGAVPGNVVVHGVEAAALWLRLKRGQRFVHAYYLAWQRSAKELVRELTANQVIDLVHHVTFCSFALPPISVLGVSGSRVVLGPAGGTASIPWQLARGTLPPRDLLREAARELNIRRALWSRHLKACLERADEVFVSTEHERVQSSKTRLSSQAGLDLSEVPAHIARSSRSSSQVHVAMVGRLEHFKGYRIAIDALACDPRLVLRVCGSGRGKPALAEYARKIGVADRVSFLGNRGRDELFEELRDADVFLSASLRETGPLSAVEAYAAGLPVVYLDAGAISQLVPPEARICVQRDLPYGQTVRQVAQALVNSMSLQVKLSQAHLEALSWNARGDTLYGSRLKEQ